MVLNSLELKNYMSFESLKLQFNDNSLYIVTGKNLDIGGKNGVGKSALIESIVFSIYGKNIRIGSKDIKELITNGKNELKSICSINNFTIIRKRSKTKNNVKILENNKDLTKRTNTETDNFINYILFPYDKFMYVNYFNPQSLIFFSLTPKQKFEIIETLLNVEIIDEVYNEYKQQLNYIEPILNKINEEIIKLKTELNIKEDNLYELDLKIKKLENEIKNIDNEFEIKRKIKDEFNKKINEIANQLKSYKNNLLTLERKLKDFSDLDFSLLDKTNQTELNNKYLEITNEIKLLENIIQTLEMNKKKGICPTCKRPFLIDENLFIYEKTNERFETYDELKEYLNSLKVEKDKVKTEIDTFNQLHSRFNQFNQLQIKKESTEKSLNEFLIQLKQLYPFHYNFLINHDNKSMFEYIEQKYDEYLKQSGKLHLEKQIYELKEEKEKIKKQISKKEKELRNLSERYEQIENLQSKINIILKELSHTGEFRQILIDKYLKELEDSLNFMIKQLNEDFFLKIYIEKSGRFKGINISIFDRGIEKSYGQLSTGEKRMVDISLLLTFSSLSKGLLLIDEALDSLSYENQLKVVNVIHNLNKQTFLVSHNERLIKDLINFNRTYLINIIKENGVSTITSDL